MGFYPEGFRLPLDLQPVFVTAGDELYIKKPLARLYRAMVSAMVVQ